MNKCCSMEKHTYIYFETTCKWQLPNCPSVTNPIVDTKLSCSSPTFSVRTCIPLDVAPGLRWKIVIHIYVFFFFSFFLTAESAPRPIQSQGWNVRIYVCPLPLLAAFLTSRGFNINTVLTTIAWKAGKAQQVTWDRWQVTQEPWNLKFFVVLNFFFFLHLCYYSHT